MCSLLGNTLGLGKASRKNGRLLLDIVQKGGGEGFIPNPKVLGYFFLAFFWTFSIEGGGELKRCRAGKIFKHYGVGHWSEPCRPLFFLKPSLRKILRPFQTVNIKISLQHILAGFFVIYIWSMDLFVRGER